MTDSLDATLTAIARTLRDARRSAKLSLDQLAAKSGVSKGTLVNLEAGSGNPSVAVLCQVATALEISLADLVQPATSTLPLVFETGAGKVVWRGQNGGTAIWLAGTSGPEMVELWEWTLHAGDRYDAVPHAKGTREILVPTSGSLGVASGSWSGIVRAPQGVLIAADVAHAYWCAGKRPVRFRMFVSEILRPGG